MKSLLFILIGLFSLNSFANNCGGEFDPVSGSCRIIGSDGRQIIYNSDPPQSAQTLPKKIINTTIIHKASKYGAYAINKKTGIGGGAIEMNSKAEARREAIKKCENGGRNVPCQIAMQVRNGCMAIAQGKIGGKWKTFYAIEKPRLTEKSALNKCNTAGASNCEITLFEACSIPEGMYN